MTPLGEEKENEYVQCLKSGSSNLRNFEKALLLRMLNQPRVDFLSVFAPVIKAPYQKDRGVERDLLLIAGVHYR